MEHSSTQFNKIIHSQVSEQAPAIETLETFWFSSTSVNVNLPQAFIEVLKITAEDGLTAEIITTASGPGIIILPKHSKNRAAGNHHEANNQDYRE